MAEKKLYVIKSKDGKYWNGYAFILHLRFARVYTSLKWVNEIVQEQAVFEPKIVEIKMYEVGADNGNL